MILRLHGDKKTMNRLANRASYAGDRLLLPGVMAAERRAGISTARRECDRDDTMM
jgi:hypothetical protein